MNFRPLIFTTFTAFCSAEVLHFDESTHFSGEVISMSQTEGLLIKHKRSPKPIAFRTDSFRFLELLQTKAPPPLETERLALTNGDILPGNLVALTTETLSFQALAGGKLQIPRTHADTLRLGIRPQTVRYEGPTPLADWDGSGVENWSELGNTQKGILIEEQGEISRDAELGNQFVISFKLSWSNRAYFRLYFGHSDQKANKKNRYYIDLSNNEAVLKREQTEGPRYVPLIDIKEVEAFDDNEVQVEIRVNRLTSTLELELDGKLVRQVIDQAPPTTGNLISISRSRDDSTSNYLSNFKVLYWDTLAEMPIEEEAGNAHADSLVNSKGERMSGVLLKTKEVPPTPKPHPEPANKPEAEANPEIQEEPEVEAPEEKKGEEEALDASPSSPENSPLALAPAPAEELKPAPVEAPLFFLMKSPFAASPIEVPVKNTRMIYFRDFTEEGASEQTEEFPKYELALLNEGLLSARNVSIQKDSITIEHPLLGQIDIPRMAIKSISYFRNSTDKDQ